MTTNPPLFPITLNQWRREPYFYILVDIKLGQDWRAEEAQASDLEDPGSNSGLSSPEMSPGASHICAEGQMTTNMLTESGTSHLDIITNTGSRHFHSRCADKETEAQKHTEVTPS